MRFSPPIADAEIHISRDLSACSAQGVCAYIASSSFECSSRTQQKNGDGRFSTLGDAVDTSGIVIFIVARTYFVIPAARTAWPRRYCPGRFSYNLPCGKNPLQRGFSQKFRRFLRLDCPNFDFQCISHREHRRHYYSERRHRAQ